MFGPGGYVERMRTQGGTTTSPGPGSGPPPQNPPNPPPAPPVPPLPPNTPPGLVSDFNAAFQDSINRLNRTNCGTIFGGQAVASAAMYNANYRFLHMGGPTRDSNGIWGVVGADTISSIQMVRLNLDGPFANLKNPTLFAPGMPAPMRFNFGTGLSGVKLGAAILLHEAGHLVGKFLPDARSDALQKQYTGGVVKGCF
jgi:hypothetical protein